MPPRPKEASSCPLETRRLLLRGFRPGDAADVFAFAQSLKVGPMAGWTPHRTLRDSQALMERFSRRRDVWALVEKSSGRVIGSINLHRDRKRDSQEALMMGYALGESFWGRGYATEAAGEILRHAFEDLHAPVVSAYHYAFNSKSRRVIQKLGMTYEGTLRLASVLPDGTSCDDCCYSITRAEYEALPKGGTPCPP